MTTPRTPPVYKDPTQHPVVQYADLYLRDMILTDSEFRIIYKSDGLPVLGKNLPQPTFESFRNRMKVLCNLNPVFSPYFQNGTTNVDTDREVDGKWYACKYVFQLTFADADQDPYFEIKGSLASWEATVDPNFKI